MKIAIIGSRNPGNINFALELEKRINPQFTLHADIKEHNIIVFDDILTTGATLDAVNKLLADKNCFFVVGIDNN